MTQAALCIAIDHTALVCIIEDRVELWNSSCIAQQWEAWVSLASEYQYSESYTDIKGSQLTNEAWSTQHLSIA